MVGGEHVPFPQGATGPCPHSLLSNGEMEHRARREPAKVAFSDAVLEFADAEHRAEK
jgi:hypothetical protein